MYQIQIFGLYFCWIVIMPGLQTTKRLSVFGGLRECHRDLRKWMWVWNRYSLVLINPVLVIWTFMVVYMAYFVWGSMNERKLALRYWGTTCDSIVQELMELRTMKQGNFNGASILFFFCDWLLAVGAKLRHAAPTAVQTRNQCLVHVLSYHVVEEYIGLKIVWFQLCYESCAFGPVATPGYSASLPAVWAWVRSLLQTY